MEIDSQWKPEFIDLNTVEGAFSFEEGFSRPDWRIISRAIRQKSSEAVDLNEAWNEAARQWLMQLQSDLGGGYRTTESPHFFLLSAFDGKITGQVLSFAEEARAHIRDRLKDAAWRLTRGKHVILLFTEQDDYYQYLSYFYREGNHPTSGGVLIHKGYVHIAIPYNPYSLRQTIAHELTHNCVAHLRLPVWLNEGLAQMFQHTLAPGQAPLLDRDLRERHLAFWNKQTIQEFWAGVSWHNPGDSNELSYSLAEIILSLLAECQGNWGAFVKQAQWADAGQTAAIECLGIDLGNVMATFLGPGDWRPRRKAMVELWEAQKKPADAPDAPKAE